MWNLVPNRQLLPAADSWNGLRAYIGPVVASCRKTLGRTVVDRLADKMR
jgi:hypothetical protein